MKQRAAFIRNAVSRGIYNTEDIIQNYNEFKYGGPEETPIYEDLPRMLRKAGLNIRVTSGYRPAGAAGKAGNRSWHTRHGAVDIVPLGNTTFEDIEDVLLNNPAIRQYMLSHNFGLIDESGRTAESRKTMRKTGATGAHFHIGRDSKYADMYRQRVGAVQPEGSNGKVVYFTNPFLSLELPASQVQSQGIVSPEEIIQNAAIVKPTEPAENIQATVLLPEIEVIGHNLQPDPIKLLALIQESAGAPPVMESYQIPLIQDTVKDITLERNTFLQKDLEDRILSEERRRRLGYSYRDGSILDDIEQMQFLRNMSANGGRLFTDGGDTDWSYNSWKRQIAEYKGIRPDEDNTYDYEAFFKKYPEEAWRMLKGDPTAHFTDEFKTVYHPTFSSKSIGNDGSIYSGIRNPKTNPQGLVGGTWSPDYHTFTMSPDGYRGPVNMDDRKWYLENAEDNGVQLREADGSLPIFDGIPWGGVLPNVIVTGNKFAEGGDTKQPVTTGGAGYVPPAIDLSKFARQIRRKLYDGIYPYGYNNIFGRVADALKGKKIIKDGNTSYADDLFAEYLRIPKEERHNVKTLKVEDSPYRPTKGDDPSIKYKRVKLPKETKELLIKGTEAFKIGQSGTNSDLWDPYSNTSKSSKSITQRYIGANEPLDAAFRLYNVGRGYDKKGEYRSIADVYDLNPWDSENNYVFGDKNPILSFFLGNKDDVSFNIGKPVHIYDRIYLDDYYGVKEPTHATYLPEVTIYGNKHKDGGNLFELGGSTDDNDPATKDWEHRREHPEVKPMYKRTKKDEEYWREKNAKNAQAAEEFNRRAGIVMDAMSDIANSTPVTSEEYKEAVDNQRQEQLDKWEDYKKGINATVTAAELGLSGASLLGAYANWKNWANAASASRRAIANLLQKAQFPMQVAGTAIDGYQTYDANSRDNAFDTYYNGASGTLGVAGSLGAADLFSPKVDRVLDALGIMQNSGDFLKFGYDTIDGFQHKDGGQLNISLDTNSYGGGGLMPGINIPSVLKNGYNAVKNRLYRTITPQGYHLGRAAKEFIKGDTRDFSKFTPAENEVWARYLGVPYEGESSFEKAVYTPTLGGATYDDVIKFKDESQVLSDDALKQLLQNQMLTGKNSMLIKGDESGLGTYTLSLGEDENGKYISYYDDWDINPTRGLSAKYKIPLIELIGDIVPGSHPFTVYGRRYYTDEDLRRVIER